jgi:hypothetical protein
MKIGYGHAGQEVQEGMIISEERAEEIFKEDLEKTIIMVNNLMQGTKLSKIR